MDLIITVDIAVAHLQVPCLTNVSIINQIGVGLKTKMHWYSQMNLIRLKKTVNGRIYEGTEYRVCFIMIYTTQSNNPALLAQSIIRSFW